MGLLSIVLVVATTTLIGNDVLVDKKIRIIVGKLKKFILFMIIFPLKYKYKYFLVLERWENSKKGRTQNLTLYLNI